MTKYTGSCAKHLGVHSSKNILSLDFFLGKQNGEPYPHLITIGQVIGKEVSEKVLIFDAGSYLGWTDAFEL